MIALIVLSLVLFAWACISTAVAVFQTSRADHFCTVVQKREERIEFLEDSLKAKTLAELRNVHPTTAMEAAQPEEQRKLYHHDPTGLISIEVDPREYSGDQVDF